MAFPGSGSGCESCGHCKNHVVFCHCLARYECDWKSSSSQICLSYLPLSTPTPQNIVFQAEEDARAAFNSLVDSRLSFTVIARHTDYQRRIPLLLRGGDGGI